MTTDAPRETILRILGEIAPEADLARIDPTSTSATSSTSTRWTCSTS